MPRIRRTLDEVNAQITATSALQLADKNRNDPVEYRVWIEAAISANQRTRISMNDRGVTLYTPSNRGGNK